MNKIKKLIQYFLKLEFIRFGIVGVINTLTDYGLMNIFLFAFNIEKGIWFTIIKTFTITISVFVSYYLNKSWTFNDKDEDKGKILKFIVLSIGTIIINVWIASVLVNKVDVSFDKKLWANLASLLGAIIAIVIRYFGSKFVVFAKKS